MKQNNFIVEKNGFLFKDLPKDKTAKELKNSISIARAIHQQTSREDMRKAILDIQDVDRNVEERQIRFVTNQAGTEQINRATEDHIREMGWLTEGRHVTPDFIGGLITRAYNTTREIVEQDLLTQLDNISREHGI